MLLLRSAAKASEPPEMALLSLARVGNLAGCSFEGDSSCARPLDNGGFSVKGASRVADPYMENSRKCRMTASIAQNTVSLVMGGEGNFGSESHRYKRLQSKL
jgi:hypothetical protein